MVKLNSCRIFCLFALIVCTESYSNSFSDGTIHRKVLRLRTDSAGLSSLIKNLVVADPNSYERLSDMANEFVYRIYRSDKTADHGVQTLQSKNVHDGVAVACYTYTGIADQIQQKLHKSFDKLKEALAEGIDAGVKFANTVPEVVSKNGPEKGMDIGNQIRLAYDEYNYAQLKLRYAAKLFYKENKEFEVKIDAGLEAVCRAIRNININDDAVEDELFSLNQIFKDVAQFGVKNLETFVLANSAHHNNTIIASKVLKDLRSSTCKILHQLTNNRYYDVVDLKTEVEERFKTYINLIKRLLQVEVNENTIGQIYIRNILFDSIALSRMYEGELNALNNRPGILSV